MLLHEMRAVPTKTSAFFFHRTLPHAVASVADAEMVPTEALNHNKKNSQPAPTEWGRNFGICVPSSLIHKLRNT